MHCKHTVRTKFVRRDASSTADVTTNPFQIKLLKPASERGVASRNVAMSRVGTVPTGDRR